MARFQRVIAANEAASAAKNAVIAVTVPEAASAATSSMISVTVPEAAAGLAADKETHARWARFEREIAEHEAVRTALTRKYRGRRGRFSSTDQKAWKSADAKLKRLLPGALATTCPLFYIGCVELGGDMRTVGMSELIVFDPHRAFGFRHGCCPKHVG